MTAELAVALPAVVVLVVVLAWGLGLAAVQVRVQDAAASAARALARGDPLPDEVIAAAADGAGVSRQWHDDDLVCVAVAASAPGPLGLRVAMSAQSCALDGGR